MKMTIWDASSSPKHRKRLWRGWVQPVSNLQLHGLINLGGIKAMTTGEDLIYHQVFTLKDGSKVLVRPIGIEDRQTLLNLFLPIKKHERQYFRKNINDPSVIESWLDPQDFKSMLPLVAIVGGAAVGVAMLCFHQGSARHRAEVRIFVAPNYRQIGLGTRMVAGLIELARRRGLQILEVEIAADQINLLKTFSNLGFQNICTLADYFISHDGSLRDVHLLVLRMHHQKG
jgi:GNAT superfamily N-acetyltransferase